MPRDGDRGGNRGRWDGGDECRLSTPVNGIIIYIVHSMQDDETKTPSFFSCVAWSCVSVYYVRMCARIACVMLFGQDTVQRSAVPSYLYCASQPGGRHSGVPLGVSLPLFVHQLCTRRSPGVDQISLFPAKDGSRPVQKRRDDRGLTGTLGPVPLCEVTAVSSGASACVLYGVPS